MKPKLTVLKNYLIKKYLTENMLFKKKISIGDVVIIGEESLDIFKDVIARNGVREQKTLTDEEVNEIKGGLKFVVVEIIDDKLLCSMMSGRRDYLLLYDKFPRIKNLRSFIIIDSKNVKPNGEKEKCLELSIDICSKDCSVINESQQSIKSCSERLTSLEIEKRDLESKIKTSKNDISLITNLYSDGVLSITKKIKKDFDDLVSSKKIVGYSFVDGNIIVTTGDIYYRDDRRAIKNFYIGAYKILFNTSRGELKAVNYKRHQSRTVFHPNIHSELFSICLGETKVAVKHAINCKKYALATSILIDFLEEPNYGTPYNYISVFANMQDVTIKPRNEMNWFSESYWRKNEVWDTDKARSEEAAARISMPNFFN